MSSNEDAIRRRAYELWEHAGRPEGRSEEFWHAAGAEQHAKETIEEGPVGVPVIEPPAFAARYAVPAGTSGA